MFTGLVESLATIAEVIAQPPGMRLVIREPRIAETAAAGDSIALNGCCLTVEDVSGDRIGFSAGEETLSRTNLGSLAPGDAVNVEPSLRAGEPLGGHFVTGHIDGVGTVSRREDDGPWCKMWFGAAAPLLLQMASKGSVAVDGVSLTLVDVTDSQFSVALIPHTLAVTTLGGRRPGDRVNIETDVLAKYVQRQLAGAPRD